jgi:prevent-host-death family protein
MYNLLYKMRTLNLYEARANLSRLVDEAANGESIVIAKGGKPLAALVPVSKVTKASFKFGTLKGKIHLADDTPKSDAEVERLFTEGGIFPR